MFGLMRMGVESARRCSAKSWTSSTMLSEVWVGQFVLIEAISSARFLSTSEGRRALTSWCSTMGSKSVAPVRLLPQEPLGCAIWTESRSPAWRWYFSLATEEQLP